MDEYGNIQILIALALFMLLLLLLLGISLLGSRLLDRRYPPDGRFMEVGKARIRYNDNGEGTAIVCLHGASSNVRDMEASIAPLLAGDFRVVTVDRPGLGHSTRSGPDWWSPSLRPIPCGRCCTSLESAARSCWAIPGQALSFSAISCIAPVRWRAAS